MKFVWPGDFAVYDYGIWGGGFYDGIIPHCIGHNDSDNYWYGTNSANGSTSLNTSQYLRCSVTQASNKIDMVAGCYNTSQSSDEYFYMPSIISKHPVSIRNYKKIKIYYKKTGFTREATHDKWDLNWEVLFHSASGTLPLFLEGDQKGPQNKLIQTSVDLGGSDYVSGSTLAVVDTTEQTALIDFSSYKAASGRPLYNVDMAYIRIYPKIHNEKYSYKGELKLSVFKIELLQ